ncbi:hypothetical protein ACRTAL_002363 [Clostridium perfringens]
MANNLEYILNNLRKGKFLIRKDGKDKVGRSYPIIKIENKNGESKYIEKQDIYLSDIDCSENNIDKINKVSIVGYSSGENYEVEYYYFNSQCNRCFAKLTNGCYIDYSPSLIDLMWNTYEVISKEEYKIYKLEQKEEPLEVTMEDIYIKFGRKVTIKPFKEK